MADPEAPKDGTETPKTEDTASMLEKLRDEMAQQNEAYRKSFDAQLAELKAQNEKLSQDNIALQKALVSSATVPQTKAEEPKTEEQLYQERIDALAKKSLGMMELY